MKSQNYIEWPNKEEIFFFCLRSIDGPFFQVCYVVNEDKISNFSYNALINDLSTSNFKAEV
ncbi:hypothetical protein DERP_001433 [Dermatophagoides pteronyssinus]|uniref:Uncharacterized protein n=1 Tax=Dermatophagoides pteronyssinus TaxID=6956 RepID=A0ABQ8JEY5_DERPT|nr:hypothetical protein DERP_001433 [Dermatophagoides pteronyssinus]